ncbi:uncharacterized protein LOC110722449 [Chenopodium quinoa]|uniref:uncharacterized protein LOC110722449 n=1 Tax=Chenopodium quinoa TaxID=63459 RepID=UPI000B782398|nr:uncharacterized protein LOC110722449 [Chenopodium quinoa]XP_021757419.1 uncharacterized protein LOC110722449 [Chenopodium quinoa]
MMLVLLRRIASSNSIVNPCSITLFNRYVSSRVCIDKDERSSYSSTLVENDNGLRNHLGGISNVPLLCRDQPQLDSREIEVVDLDTWSISSGLSSVLKSEQKESQLRMVGLEEVDDHPDQVEGDPDIDEIEDMRLYGSLFYKIEKSSMEFEEYKFDYHGKKLKSSTNDEKESKKKESLKCDLAQNRQKSLKGQDSQQASSKKPGSKDCFLVNKERLVKTIEENYVICDHDRDGSSAGKKLRSPTFNQLTGPFHEPFCLDIHVSKGSVRACVVHRVTSKVVVVAHSISKDMKFGLGSTKSRVAASSVGTVLAQRALADDIHDVIYTPRKGDKLEGKLQLVLQSIIDNGVYVKVKLKQRNPGKPIRRHVD